MHSSLWKKCKIYPKIQTIFTFGLRWLDWSWTFLTILNLHWISNSVISCQLSAQYIPNLSHFHFLSATHIIKLMQRTYRVDLDGIWQSRVSLDLTNQIWKNMCASLVLKSPNFWNDSTPPPFLRIPSFWQKSTRLSVLNFFLCLVYLFVCFVIKMFV